MKIITMCGSFKYQEEIIAIAEKLCLEKNCVLSPLYPICDKKYSEYEKDILGQMHLERIKISDAIVVVDIDNYIGDATKNEIEYAKSLNKEIIYYSELVK